VAGNQPLAVVLFSGGLDSATLLALAREQGFAVLALSFDYGQRHAAELAAARRVAAAQEVVEHRIVQLPLNVFSGSALTDPAIAVPEAACDGIPVTYVPARNTLFLSFALAVAEAAGAHDIFIGVNAVDYSGYPDCRPEYIAAFEQMARLATRASVQGSAPRIRAPLIHWSKADIIRAGLLLGVDYALTVSCYQADTAGRACGRCDSCRLRAEGFRAAGVADPTPYR
jgi:7-cyano-7-deazaguanine synthase